MSQPDPQASDLVGTVLGDAYRLTRLIGRGGMGSVYEGVQLRLNKRVAVKLMARELSANAEALARFRREAEVTSQLGHPHIVQVFDFGAAPGGEPYLVMEFLEGEDLEQRMRRVGRMAPAAAAHIVKQIASALSATHAKGIVHRDLKPANVFVLAVEGETDFVKVVDFGISKVRAAATRLTAAAAVMGTPNYMSPEQAAGQVDEIDHRTDQWALGCIAYELIAGRPPFVGESVASLLYQVVHQAPSPLAANAPGASPDIEQVLGCALAKKQADRFASMTAFARAFEAAAISGSPAVAATAALSSSIAAAPAGSRPPLPATELSAATPPPSSPPLAEKANATTFSAAAGESTEPAAPPRPRSTSRWVAAGGVVAALVVGAALLGARHHADAPTSSASAVPVVPVTIPAPAPTAAASPPPAVAPPVAPPAPAPPPVAAGATTAGKPAASAKPARARRTKVAGAPSYAPAVAPPPAPEPPPPPAPPPPQQEAAPPSSDTPAWPPPPGTDTSQPPPRQRRHFIRDLKRRILD